MDTTQPGERWLPVPGYEGFYEVSDLGRVRSVDRITRGGRGNVARSLRGKVRRFKTSHSGHLRLVLSKDGSAQQCWVHRLVLEAFVGPCPDGMECCHNDGVPGNNCVTNLRWDTKSENLLDQVRHGTHAQACKAQCVNGHDFDDENTIQRRNGGRDCRICQRDRNREMMRAKRARLRVA